MQENKRIIIWPTYLDLSRSRKEGRLASKASAVRTPRILEIQRAAEKLGLHPEVVSDNSHPSMWWEKTGYVTVDNIGPKSDLLRRIGAEIIRMRGGKQ